VPTAASTYRFTAEDTERMDRLAALLSERFGLPVSRAEVIRRAVRELAERELSPPLRRKNPKKAEQPPC